MGQDLLTPLQRRILAAAESLKPLTDRFVLSGGTALSVFHLHHRESEDLDFFTARPLDSLDANELARALAALAKARLKSSTQSFNRNLYSIGQARRFVKVELTYYPHEPIEPPLRFGKLRVDSLRDIAANKLFTIYERGRARDYVDLHLSLKVLNCSLARTVADARAKFDVPLDGIQLGAGLLRASQVKDFPRMRVKVDRKALIQFFENEALSLKKRVLK